MNLSPSSPAEVIVATVSVGSFTEFWMFIRTIARKVCGSSVCDTMVPTLMPLMRTSPPSRVPSIWSNFAVTS